MGNIVLLDELTINKIAAGEVIERPASVIKEMVENSIDAGATNITVEIKNGGISYIKVTDNGKGIAQDDLEIAFERHATSKIRTADDLNTVTSMGFRGEALASIAAISNVEMISKTKDQETGYKIVVEGGDVLEKEEVGCTTGTSITVRNLFYNTPVRYKFLKKDYTESGYIEDVVTRIALVNPNIAIKLINTGKTVIQTNGNSDLQSVVYSIYGKDSATGIMEVSYQYEDITITGVIGKPEVARSNRSNQLFFVNKRYIKDKTLSAATEQAYKGLIPLGKFGFVILNLEMNPSKVDVNVHPAKLEVRFEEENKVFQSIYHAIKDTLLKNELVAESAPNRRELTFEERLNTIKEARKENLNGGLFSFRKQTEKKIEQYTNDESKIKTNIPNEIKEETEKYELEKPNEDIKQEFEEVKEKIEKLDNNPQVVSKDFNEMYSKMFGTVPVNANTEPENQPKEEVISENKNEVEPLEKEEETTEIEQTEKIKEANEQPNKPTNMSIFENTEKFSKPEYKLVGIIFNTYIILEIDQEMYILDQHAAHERILYEQVKKNYYSDINKDSQMLLLPDIITLTHKEMELARENFEMFEQAGFVLEEFGENTIKLNGVPTICVELDTKELFLETLDEINNMSRTSKQEKEEKFIATVACKAAIKANMVIEEREVKALMDELLELPNPFTCPHGRPTVIKMSKYEIERKFARK